MTKTLILSLAFLIIRILMPLNAQIIPIGSGSYTLTFPGTDAAGRNGYPSGSPQISGNALGKPIPTNDWWSKLIKENHADNLFNYPYTLKTINTGLIVSYIPWGVIDDQVPVVVGVSGLSTTRTTVSDYSDWTVTMNWNDGSRLFEATSGIAMPFLYFNKGNQDVAQVTVNSGTVTINGEMLILDKAKNGASFVVYAPTGSVWQKNGNIYTSTLNGKNYWSMAFLPLTVTDISGVAQEYMQYAYVFPKNTEANFQYDEQKSVVRTDFTVETDIKEGTAQHMLIGLLPHQWANLASNSPQPQQYSYRSVRGEIKTLKGNHFSVENTYYGILPTLPYVDHYSAEFNPGLLNQKIKEIQHDVIDRWTDSYNDGQLLNRLIQTARIADEIGNTEARDLLVATVKERVEDWLTAVSGERAFLFYYNATWSAMLGYPAGHGQDTNLNDHHFHWGYFIHAASFLEQYLPGWASAWGEMIQLLVRDAASDNRNDTMFPYLRNFSPYAGHSWANGFATFPQGNDQESTSESMQFNSSLIHWGTITGNKALRDLGIYLYTTEQTAVEEYWMDIHGRNFPPTQAYSIVSRVWGNSFDNGTFWTGDIAASYGIELYPIHGGSLYLGHHLDYTTKLWNEIQKNTGIMSNQANVNLWHDVMWKYSAFVDPDEAIRLYNSYPDRALKFGISDAQTYHWLHAMRVLGNVNASITADYPIAAAFTKNGQTTYVAHNYSNVPLTVNFSTGFSLNVPARKMATSIDSQVRGAINTPYREAYPGGNITLDVEITEGSPSKVVFMHGDVVISTQTSTPYSFKTQALPVGIHSFYANIYENDERFNHTNAIEVVVGEQQPWESPAPTLPGIIEAGKYDRFEGGKGQNISYLDLSPANHGTFRTDEGVDATLNTSEGAVVGWIQAGEWLEYTVEVQQTGLYSMAFRYASGNPVGGGPFTLSAKGKIISENITVPSTSTTRWDVWSTKTVNNIPLQAGRQILRVSFAAGEFNLGRMTFTRTGDLPYTYPTAVAGENIKVMLPATTADLDGSGSSESGANNLQYQWSQIYGPSVANVQDANNAKATVNNLQEGMYRFRLMVSNDALRTDIDDVLVMVTGSENVPPTVAITGPATNSTFPVGTTIMITASANDFDGEVAKVDFYVNDQLLGTSATAPYKVEWNPMPGDYVLMAKATDLQGGEGYSQNVQITISPVYSCSGESKQASQGSFTDGYRYRFETIGTTVNITFELLDNKAGVIAYLWQQTPFAESQMTHVSGKTFTASVGGVTPGTTLRYACKFAFAGGMSVTQYISYVVGNNCDRTNLERTQQELISIYPNPAQHEIYLSLPHEENIIQMRDLRGQLLKEVRLDAPGSIDIQDFPAGIYIIAIKNSGGIQSTRLLKTAN